MSGDGPDSRSKLSHGLRKFLTVTEPDGAPKTGRVEPSGLLGRLENFLPQLKAANEALQPEDHGQQAVQIEKVKTSKPLESEEIEETERQQVKMDLYVDESLGELVGTSDEKNQKDAKHKTLSGQLGKRPLIQVLSESELPKESDAKKREAGSCSQ